MAGSTFLDNAVANAVCNNTSFVVAQTYTKLHTADPTKEGTAAAALNTTRQSSSYGVSAAGVCANDVAVAWTNVPNAETYTHFSVWDAATAGNCIVTGAITTPRTVAAGDDFDFPIGQLTFTVN